MDNLKVAVVTRHLWPDLQTSSVVVSAVIGEASYAVDNTDQYLTEKAQRHIEEFCNKFVEFKHANWSIQIMEVQ